MDEFVNMSLDRYEKLIEELTELRLKVKELEKAPTYTQLPYGALTQNNKESK